MPVHLNVLPIPSRPSRPSTGTGMVALPAPAWLHYRVGGGCHAQDPNWYKIDEATGEVVDGVTLDGGSEAFKRQVPAGVGGAPSDIGAMVTFLCSNNGRSKSIYCFLFTENLLENTPLEGVGVPHQCSLGVAACYLLVMLTRAVLMTSSQSKVGISTARRSTSTAA